MYILDVINNDKGQLYTQKLHLPNGFNRLGDRFIACDLHGNIYMFDLNYNRFMRLNRIGTSCTALAYNLKCKTEYLVATIDGTIKCFNAETKDLVGWMKGHEKPIISLSVHTNGELVISFSSDIAQLWDLKTFECKQKLNINSKQNVEIIKICFAPYTNDIVSAFKDDTIYVWSCETVELKCQFTLNENDMIYYKCYTISSDGKLLVAAGRSNQIYVWNIDTKSLMKIINLTQTIQSIKDCILLSGSYENKILIMLTQDGLIEIVNIDNDKHLCTLNSSSYQTNTDKIINMSVSNLNSPRYLCTISEGGTVQVYDLDSSIISKYKVTSALMKSTTINSTTTNNVNGAANNASVASKSVLANSSSNTLNSQNAKKQIVCKRAQAILNNEQIYTKLVQILKCYGEYPARYRMFIWKLLLKLPENYESYGALIEKGLHTAYADLHKKYPIKSQKCNRLLQRVLSALAHWSPIFGECEYLPLLVFPFVKLFVNNHLVCFEVIATFITNWCQYWFEFFPNPPLNILSMIENLIAYHDKVLIEHFMRYRITSQIYAWSLLETIFSEVFSKNDWQILFDNIFSNHPGYLLYLAAAYSICNRSSLIKVTEIDDARFFFRHRNPLSVHHLMREATRMKQSTPADIDPMRILSHFEPLHKGNYPVFNKRPKFISDYQTREKQKILQQEIDYLKEREQHIESHKLNEGRKLENEYLLKQMLWDKQQSQAGFKPTFLEYKQVMEGYDNAQKSVQINVAGEPIKYTDSTGFTFMNKMRKIDENFDDIENALTANRQSSAPVSAGGFKKANNNENDEECESTDFDINEIENEILRNTSDLFNKRKINNVGNSFNNSVNNNNSNQSNGVNNKNVKIDSDIVTHINNNRIKSQLGENNHLRNTNKCLNESEATSVSTSTLLSLDRGRQNLESQERDLMKRVYELRKNLAIENRRQQSAASTANNNNVDS